MLTIFITFLNESLFNKIDATTASIVAQILYQIYLLCFLNLWYFLDPALFSVNIFKIRIFQNGNFASFKFFELLLQ